MSWAPGRAGTKLPLVLHGRRRQLLGLGALACAGLVLWAGPSLATRLLEFHAPHHAARSRAVLSAELVRAVAAARAEAAPRGVSALIDFALRQTRPRLRFGLDHPSSLGFDPREREGNCIEYSHLFASIFDRSAVAAGIDAQAFVVHSDRALLFGQRVPRRGWASHDWVLVVERDRDRAEVARYFIDPAFDDASFGWNIESDVFGRVDLPAVRAP